MDRGVITGADIVRCVIVRIAGHDLPTITGIITVGMAALIMVGMVNRTTGGMVVVTVTTLEVTGMVVVIIFGLKLSEVS